VDQVLEMKKLQVKFIPGFCLPFIRDMCYDILMILLYIYARLDPGAYMIARFMSFVNRV